MIKAKEDLDYILNTAVFTTNFVLQDKKTITLVSHETEDGAWQFFSDDFFDNFEDVVNIVGLSEIFELDSSLIELLDMPAGYRATRKGKHDKWNIVKIV